MPTKSNNTGGRGGKRTDAVQAEIARRKEHGINYKSKSPLSGKKNCQTSHVVESEVKYRFITAYNKLMADKSNR